MLYEIPEITVSPVIDTPKTLDWPFDGGIQEPSLSEPTANVTNDLHAGIGRCDMVLTTAGNYHMALKDLWDLYLTKFSAAAPLHNWCYTTSPPVAKQQIANGVVQFGNVRVRCRPQIAVGPRKLVDSLTDAGLAMGSAVPVSKTRGNVLLVKKGNPAKIYSIWDLGRENIRVVTPNPLSERGSFMLYALSVFGIAKNDKNPPRDFTAESLFNAVFNNAQGAEKWLSGKRIHHREVPWSIAYGRGDAAVIFYHLALHARTTFPDLFDIIALGGTAEDPRPVPGNHTETLYAVRIEGDWSEKQRDATEKLMGLYQSPEFGAILRKYGLETPDTEKIFE
jgi:hypothetical protein